MVDDIITLLGTLLVIIIVVVIGIFFLSKGIGNIFDSHAAQIRAEAQLEGARMNREHQQSVDSEREFRTYAITLKAFSNDNTVLLVVLAGLLGMVVAGLIITLIDLYWKR